MKKGKGKAKGGAFERFISKTLSMWWTDGVRDDIFWRSSSSGGRATQRATKNKTTFGQYGDIQYTDPIGKPLIDLCVIELKTGYNNQSPYDMLEKTKASCVYYEWVGNLVEGARCGHAPYWLLIHKRDQRQPIVCMNNDLYFQLPLEDYEEIPIAYIVGAHKPFAINCIRLGDFLTYVRPKHIKRIARQRCHP